MDVLIKDLLAFSHVGRIDIQKKKVSLETLLRDVVWEIKEEVKERDGRLPGRLMNCLKLLLTERY